MFFSVIVPIYNIEKYLRKCIDSVLSQTFSDFELILVDDGSPDCCGIICDEYAKADSRIKVIHKKNGGLVSARQAGLEMANGRYIFNLDGDDFIANDALESAYKVISDTDADIVCFSYREFANGKECEVTEDILPERLYNKQEIEEYIFPKLLCDENMEHIFYYLWGKAIKRELVQKHQMKVEKKISLGEDICCTIPCFSEAGTVYMSKKSVYFYTTRNDSLSTDFKTAQITQLADVISYLQKLEVKKPVDFDEQISRYSAFMCFAVLAAAAEGGHFESIKQLKKLILNSMHKEKIKKAEFKKLTPKTAIAMTLMKKHCFAGAFCFMYLCKLIKNLKKKG